MRVLLVVAVVVLAGCSSIPEHEREARAFVERWGGVDPLATANLTLEAKLSGGFAGRCTDGVVDNETDCHFAVLVVSKTTKGQVLLTHLAFRAVLSDGSVVRANGYEGDEFLYSGSINVTVSFSVKRELTIVRIEIGYLDGYATTDVPSYDVEEAMEVEKVTFTVLNATIHKGRCFDGAGQFNSECHTIELRVDNTRRLEELPVSPFYWGGVDSNGLVQRPYDANGAAVARGAMGTLDLRFELPLDTPTRFKEIQYQDAFRNRFGNATVAPYAPLIL